MSGLCLDDILHQDRDHHLLHHDDHDDHLREEVEEGSAFWWWRQEHRNLVLVTNLNLRRGESDMNLNFQKSENLGSTFTFVF